MADDDKQKAPQRSKAQIERDIAAARARLSGNIESLITEAHPKTLVNRQVDNAKAFVKTEVDAAKEGAKSQVMDAEGNPRWTRIGVIGGAVAGALTFILTIRAIVTRNKKKKATYQLDELVKELKKSKGVDVDELLARFGR